jgi:phosphatidylglycerophosphate synthase
VTYWVVGECTTTLWGISLSERLRRTFDRLGLEPTDADRPGASIVLARADYVFEDRLIKALIDAPDRLVQINGVPVAAHVPSEGADAVAVLLSADKIDDSNAAPDLQLETPASLAGDYNEQLRKKLPPYAFAISDTSITEIEKATFGASYKGATDLVTKFLWPLPARIVTKWAALAGLTPNMVTTASLALVFVTMWLFMRGDFLLGCLVGWAMTFLDTVDGKLARVTLTYTKWGDVYDHGIDLIHPPFWWWAWWAGLQISPEPWLVAPLNAALGVIVVGYVLGRVLEGIFLWGFKFETHIWRPIDYFFRHITARRNPNLAILMVGALAGRPDLGFLTVAAWTVFSLGFHSLRLTQAVGLRLMGGRVASYLQQSG